MKARFSGWVLLACALFASSGTASELSNLAPHPTMVFARIDGEEHRVVGASRQKARVVVDGKEVSADKKAGYRIACAAGFAPGEITVRQIEGGTLFVQVRDMDSGVLLRGGAGRSECHLEIVADRDIPDAYCALLFDLPLTLIRHWGSSGATLIFKEIGDLRMGVKKDVVVDLGRLSMWDRARLVFFPMFFSGGREIRSSLWEQSGAYGRFLEMARHRDVMKGYLEKNAGKDHDFTLYMRFPPAFRSKAVSESLPAEIRPEVVFAEDGVVTDVVITENLPAEAAEDIRRCLSSWLALPPLSGGVPRKTRIVVPLKLGGE